MNTILNPTLISTPVQFILLTYFQQVKKLKIVSIALGWPVELRLKLLHSKYMSCIISTYFTFLVIVITES